MRRIHLSGGLELGVPDAGPWIDIISMPPGRKVALEESAEAAKYATWLRWTRDVVREVRMASLIAPGMIGVVGTSEGEEGVPSVAIRFLWPRRQSPFEALRTIEMTEGGLPPSLAGALLAAAQARRYPVHSETAGAIAIVCDLVPQGRPSLFSRREIEQFVKEYIRLLADPAADSLNVNIPSGAADRARFWLVLARRLWQPDVLRRLARAVGSASKDLQFLMAATLAGARLELDGSEAIEIGGVSLSISKDSLPETREIAWRQAVEGARGEVPREAVQYLFSGRFGSIDPFKSLEAADAPYPDPDLAMGLVRALTREAAERARYAPSGGFRVQLPSDYPLKAWRIHGFRVWAFSGGLWAAPLSDQGPWPAFLWRPGSLPSGWVVPKALRPLMAATMAALWRDLHVAGEEAVPTQDAAQRRRLAAATSSSRRRFRSGEAPRQSVRVLPARSRRWLALSGARRWGSEEERRTIRRRAHGVRGHLRRLPPGWKASPEAKEIAKTFNVPVPDGYTFVRPHLRGSGSTEVRPAVPEDAVIVQARGLAAVMSLLSLDD